MLMDWGSEAGEKENSFRTRYSKEMWQFCTIGPGGTEVGLEWDGSQQAIPNPDHPPLAIFWLIIVSVPKINA